MSFMRVFSKWIIWTMSYTGFMRTIGAESLPDWLHIAISFVAGMAYIVWLTSEND